MIGPTEQAILLVKDATERVVGVRDVLPECELASKLRLDTSASQLDHALEILRRAQAEDLDVRDLLEAIDSWGQDYKEEVPHHIVMAAAALRGRYPHLEVEGD